MTPLVAHRGRWSFLCRSLSPALFLVVWASGAGVIDAPAAHAETARASAEAAGGGTDETGKSPKFAAAALEAKDDRAGVIHGVVSFVALEEGVRVEALVTGLLPGKHGIHIHEHGDCSAADFSSAGGHFAPSGSPHGGPEKPATERHVGDLGNLEASTDGVGRYDRIDPVIELSGPRSIVGRTVIVHAGRDDLVSQPSGDSGDRIACGVVKAF